MRNLSRLSWAANNRDNGPKKVDRRKLPLCSEPGCRRRVEKLPDGSTLKYCYRHAPQDEMERYFSAWDEAMAKSQQE